MAMAFLPELTAMWACNLAGNGFLNREHSARRVQGKIYPNRLAVRCASRVPVYLLTPVQRALPHHR